MLIEVVPGGFILAFFFNRFAWKLKHVVSGF
jgi:hypothetical protein